MDVKEGSRYFYRIQAVNASMVEGEMSEPVKVVTSE
jgi:hypothetical protein